MRVSYLIPENEPVRLLWGVLEGIDFTAYEKETTTGSTQEQFALWVMEMMNGNYFVWRKSVEKHMGKLKEKAAVFGASGAEEAAEPGKQRRGGGWPGKA